MNGGARGRPGTRCERGGAAPLLLAAAFVLFIATAGLGAAELAHATAQVTLARRALQAGLMAGARAGADGAARCQAFGQTVARNLPDMPHLQLACSQQGQHLQASLGWNYRFAFLPLPPARLAVQQEWPLAGPAPAPPGGVRGRTAEGQQ